MRIELKEGNSTTLKFICTNREDKAPINLTGASGVLKWYIDEPTTITNSNLVITDELTGRCEYTFTTAQLTYGVLHYEVELNLPGPKIFNQLNNGQIPIRRRHESGS